ARDLREALDRHLERDLAVRRLLDALRRMPLALQDRAGSLLRELDLDALLLALRVDAEAAAEVVLGIELLRALELRGQRLDRADAVDAQRAHRLAQVAEADRVELAAVVRDAVRGERVGLRLAVARAVGDLDLPVLEAGPGEDADRRGVPAV